jgi:hypothetical protein
LASDRLRPVLARLGLRAQVPLLHVQNLDLLGYFLSKIKPQSSSLGTRFLALLRPLLQSANRGGQDLVNNLQQKENENKAMELTAKCEDTAYAKYLPLEKTKAAITRKI